MVTHLNSSGRKLFTDEDAEIIKGKFKTKFIYDKSGVYHNPKVVGNDSNHIKWDKLTDRVLILKFIKQELRKHCTSIGYNPKLVYLLNTSGNWKSDNLNSELHGMTKKSVERWYKFGIDTKKSHRITVTKGEITVLRFKTKQEVTYKVPHALISILFHSVNPDNYDQGDSPTYHIDMVGI